VPAKTRPTSAGDHLHHREGVIGYFDSKAAHL
jgi:hypothetical protein